MTVERFIKQTLVLQQVRILRQCVVAHPVKGMRWIFAVSRVGTIEIIDLILLRARRTPPWTGTRYHRTDAADRDLT